MFPASIDKTSKIITLALVIFSLGFNAFILYVSATEHQWVGLLPTVVLPFIILLTWLYSPYAYSVEGNMLLVHRRVSNYKVSLHNLVEVNTLDKKAMGYAIRLMGNGGLFGYTGWYASSPQGRMRWFVRQQKNFVVLIFADNKKVVLSPNDPEGLVMALREQLPHS